MEDAAVAPGTRKTQLFVAISPDELWREFVAPWFEVARRNAWRRVLPTVVLVPNQTHAHALKTKLLQKDSSYLGLHFLTPLRLREFLAAHLASSSQWPHLRLLLAAAAGQSSPEQLSEPAARSVLREPDTLLRTLERIEAAGWRFDELRFPSLQAIVRRFDELLRACSFALPAKTDRELAAQAATRPPKIDNLLITGFDAAHWPLWFLLQAAARSAKDCTVCLRAPRDEARDLDETWIGTWEETYGPAEFGQPPAPPGETLFPELFEPELFREAPRRREFETYFLVGRDVTEQATAIVALVETFLSSGAAERIGILFPAAGALPRLVAMLLSGNGIPHFDGIGFIAPGPLEEIAWPLWLQLQETPRLDALLRFVRASAPACRVFGGLAGDELGEILGRAARNLLLDDLNLVRAYCAAALREQRIVAGLDAIVLLPERATLADFVEQSCAAFDAFGWSERRSHLEQTSAEWAPRLTAPIARATYLRWLGEVSTSMLPQRSANSDHPYARVHLLFPAQADGQSWSHLIFAGLNEGSWPARPNESGFVDELEIAGFNAAIRKFNRASKCEGRYGEGHSIAGAGRTFYLGPVEERALCERQFQSLRESATVAIAATANLIEENAPERYANPSEFFTRLYVDARGEAPGEQVLSALAERTAQWLSRREATAPPPDDDDVAQTAIAYRARHAPDVPFGEYMFGLREPLERQLVLSATDCERIIKAPALVWLRKFLGVEAREDELANWNIAIGQWVHDWLRQIAPTDGDFAARPSAADVRGRVRRAAVAFREHIAELLGRRLPDWWLSGWNQAVFIAEALAETITTTEEWSHFATEWTLSPIAIPVCGNAHLEVRGRIDLILGRAPVANALFPFREAWIIDYKTGRRASLAPKRKALDKAAEDFRSKLLEGKGVQLAIYALALSTLGVERVGASLLTRELELDDAQVALPVIQAQHAIWENFAQLSRSGVFGMRGALRAEFGFQNNYPLATLGFDPDFLEEKWTRTHPALPKIEKR